MKNFLISESNSILSEFPTVDLESQAFWDKGLKEVRAEIQSALPGYIISSRLLALRIAEKSQTKCLN